jgi:hypothetical protein
MPNSTLQFYHDLVFHNGIEVIFTSYINNHELITNGFEYLQEYDYYLKDEMVIDGLNPKFEITIINRVKFFENSITKQRYLLYQNINDNLKELSVLEKVILIKEYYNQLEIITVKVETLDGDFINIIKNEILKIIGDLKIKFQNIVEYHTIFRKLTIKTERVMSIFQSKPEITYKFFGQLYDVASSLYLIDDTEISEEMFVDVFASANPEPPSKIIFDKSNLIVAFFLKEIEPFFENFNAVSIEKSKLFSNKQGKYLKSNDLYVALSRNKDNSHTYLIKIQNEINLLKKQYLK